MINAKRTRVPADPGRAAGVILGGVVRGGVAEDGDRVMASKTTASPPGMRDAFTYTPGDGKRYVWSGDYARIAVEDIGSVGGVLTFRDTGDRIPVPEARTATALMMAVDEWRAAV